MKVKCFDIRQENSRFEKLASQNISRYNHMLHRRRTAHGMEKKNRLFGSFCCTLVRNSAFFFFSSSWSFFSLAFSSAIRKTMISTGMGIIYSVQIRGRMLPSCCEASVASVAAVHNLNIKEM